MGPASFWAGSKAFIGDCRQRNAMQCWFASTLAAVPTAHTWREILPGMPSSGWISSEAAFIAAWPYE